MISNPEDYNPDEFRIPNATKTPFHSARSPLTWWMWVYVPERGWFGLCSHMRRPPVGKHPLGAKDRHKGPTCSADLADCSADLVDCVLCS